MLRSTCRQLQDQHKSDVEAIRQRDQEIARLQASIEGYRRSNVQQAESKAADDAAIESLKRQITNQLEREAKAVATLEAMNRMQACSRDEAYAACDALARREIERAICYGKITHHIESRGGRAVCLGPDEMVEYWGVE